MKRSLAMAAVLLTAIVLLYAQDSDAANPAARTLDRAKGKRLYDLRYADRRKKVDATAAKDDDVALAAEHLGDVSKFREYPSLALVVCEQAFELGMRHRDGYATAAAAAEALLADFPEQKADALTKAFRAYEAQYRTGVDRDTAGARVIELHVASADEAAGKGDFGVAFQFLLKAYPIASALKSPRKDELLSLRNYYQARRDLQKNPSDLKLRAEAIRLAIAERDDPAAATTLLVGDLDEKTRTYVPLAATPTAVVEEAPCLELGNWYLELAGGASPHGKAVCLTRATTYLTRYLALHKAKDEPRIQAELLLDKVAKQLDGIRTALAPKTKPTPAPKTGEGKWIDLLKSVDLKRHAVAGEWSLTPDGLKTGVKQSSRLAFPVRPAGDYELLFSFTSGKTDWINAFALLPVGSSSVTLALGGTGGDTSGLSDIKGNDYRKNATTVRGSVFRVIPGRRYAVHVEVKVEDLLARVAVTVDKRRIIQWHGPIGVLKPISWTALPDPTRLGIGANLTTTVFHQVKLRMRSGEAKVVE